MRKLTSREISIIRAKLAQNVGLKMLLLQGHVSTATELAGAIGEKDYSIISQNLNQLL